MSGDLRVVRAIAVTAAPVEPLGHRLRSRRREPFDRCRRRRCRARARSAPEPRQNDTAASDADQGDAARARGHRARPRGLPSDRLRPRPPRPAKPPTRTPGSRSFASSRPARSTLPRPADGSDSLDRPNGDCRRAARWLTTRSTRSCAWSPRAGSAPTRRHRSSTPCSPDPDPTTPTRPARGALAIGRGTAAHPARPGHGRRPDRPQPADPAVARAGGLRAGPGHLEGDLGSDQRGRGGRDQGTDPRPRRRWGRGPDLDRVRRRRHRRPADYHAPMTTPDSLPFTGDPDADRLLAEDPLALLIGFALDQQVTVQKAFSGPADLKRRLGHLDAARIAAMDPAELDAVFRERPAIHRFPGAMAGKVQALCRGDRDDYGNDAATRLARRGRRTGPRDAAPRPARDRGDEGQDRSSPCWASGSASGRPGWTSGRADTPTLGDVDSPEALATLPGRQARPQGRHARRRRGVTRPVPAPARGCTSLHRATTSERRTWTTTSSRALEPGPPHRHHHDRPEDRSAPPHRDRVPQLRRAHLHLGHRRRRRKRAWLANLEARPALDVPPQGRRSRRTCRRPPGSSPTSPSGGRPDACRPASGTDRRRSDGGARARSSRSRSGTWLPDSARGAELGVVDRSTDLAAPVPQSQATPSTPVAEIRATGTSPRRTSR